MENELDDPSPITFERGDAVISIEGTLQVSGEVEFHQDPGPVPMRATYTCEGYYDEDDERYDPSWGVHVSKPRPVTESVIS